LYHHLGFLKGDNKRNLAMFSGIVEEMAIIKDYLSILIPSFRLS